MTHRSLQIILIVFLSALAIAGFAVDGGDEFSEFWDIQLQPARLISDFIETAGIGGALLNAAVMGAIGLVISAATGVPISGPNWAAVFTMVGFGLFGKTPVNALPIILGVYISARTVGKGLREYLLIALFGTALGPLVSALAWELGLAPLPAILVGTAGGILTGFLLPPIAIAMLHLHQGYSLYNMGLACGFLGLFAAAFIRGFGVSSLPGLSSWSTGSHPVLMYMVPTLSLGLIIAGYASKGTKAFADLKRLLRIPGRLPSDFVEITSPEAMLLNAGLIGLIGSAYVWISGAPFNGPVIGGLLTIMGFAAFGTHLRNAWPVVAGVYLAILATGNSPGDPGPILAAIFCTTLAPLAGSFGIIAGLIAGFIHFIMVMQTGSWQGGMNLYNNGFAGGFTAGIIISVIQWYRANKAVK